jgi:hypothetical protein
LVPAIRSGAGLLVEMIIVVIVVIVEQGAHGAFLSQVKNDSEIQATQVC